MDKDYSFPKYKIIYDVLKQRIIDGKYSDNNYQIPDELTLCDEFKCSRMTMKKALDILVSEGFIYRKRGHGSFVLYKNSYKNSVLQLFDQDLVSFSELTENECTSKVLEFQLLFADEEIANKLNIHIQDSVYKIVRLRSLDNEPYLIETTYISTTLVPGLTLEILSNSLFHFIENETDLKITSSQRTLRAMIPNEIDIHNLLLEVNEPVLELEEIVYLSNGKIFEYSTTHYRFDKIEFTAFAQRK